MYLAPSVGDSPECHTSWLKIRHLPVCLFICLFGTSSGIHKQRQEGEGHMYRVIYITITCLSLVQHSKRSYLSVSSTRWNNRAFYIVDHLRTTSGLCHTCHSDISEWRCKLLFDDGVQTLAFLLHIVSSKLNEYTITVYMLLFSSLRTKLPSLCIAKRPDSGYSLNRMHSLIPTGFHVPMYEYV